ncbi:MAG TPA: cohesin domain-containing protein [Bryobacteraceae bacterium]|nr:cohesin domain-containing protein [Bryobacteraceae bacterium]
MKLIPSARTLVFTFAVTVFSSCSWGAVLSFDPSNQSANVGSDVVVDLVISGLGNGISPALAGFSGMQIGFDTSILQPVSAAFTNRLGDIGDPSAVVYSVNTFFPGVILLDQVSLLDPTTLFGLQASPTGSFVLATLKFNAIGGGTSALTIDPGVLSDELGNQISATAQNGSVTVRANGPIVPEPSTWLLLASGFGAFVVYRRR